MNCKAKNKAKVSIKKGNTFLCRKTMVRNGVELYTQNQLYRSTENNSIAANCGTPYFCFNSDVFEAHFIKN